MGFCYILRCADGTFYVGSTLDLGRRLEQHAQGLGSAYTRRRLPVELVWSEEFAGIDEAFRWEKRIQGWSHIKRAAFIEGGLDAIVGWSARQRAGAGSTGSGPSVVERGSAATESKRGDGAEVGCGVSPRLRLAQRPGVAAFRLAFGSLNGP